MLKKDIFTLPQMARDSLLAFRERLLLKSAMVEKPWLHHYDAGVPFEIDPPSIPLYELLQRAFAEAGSSPAILYFNRRFSYNHLYTMVARFAAGLQRLGVRPGESVALCMPNMPQFLIAYWATLYIGGVVVPVNPLLSSRELLQQLQITRARVLVVLDRLYPRVEQIRAQTQLRHVVVAFLETYMSPMANFAFQFRKRIERAEAKIRRTRGTLFFRQLLRYPPLTRAMEVDPGGTAVMLFTGGVTGQPKAAALSHNNVVVNALQTRAWLSDIREGKEVLLAALPFSHSYAMSACHHLAILIKGMMVLEPRFEVKRILRQLRRQRVTLLPGVPAMFSGMITRLTRKPVAIPSVRLCISGGAPLPPEVKQQFEALTGGRLLQGYGLTEASPITHCNPQRGVERPGSIGLPGPSTQARIVDLRSRAVLKPGEIGELEVRGPQVMQGYFEQEVETRAVIDAEGWLSTGDIAWRDKDGYFYIVDRKKEILFCGGYNVYPGEIERVLCGHPAVQEAAVVPMADAYLGEVPRAFLVLRPGAARPADSELQEYCRRRLARYKIPRRFSVVAALPHNLLGKVLKRELQAWQDEEQPTTMRVNHAQ